MTAQRTALALFSGGQDSTACLAWALDAYPTVETVGFAYGQRHAIEVECRGPIRDALSERWGGRLGPDHLIDITPSLAALGQTAMTSDVAIAMSEDGLPNTFVPGRNLLFFTFAATVADRRGLSVLIGGMCETDFSGYPDCRDNSLRALQVAISLGLDAPMTLDTPLMWLDKAQTWALTEQLGGDALIDLVVEHTHTCYLGDRSQRHAWGHGCGLCPACDLRRKGYHAWVNS